MASQREKLNELLDGFDDFEHEMKEGTRVRTPAWPPSPLPRGTHGRNASRRRRRRRCLLSMGSYRILVVSARHATDDSSPFLSDSSPPRFPYPSSLHACAIRPLAPPRPRTPLTTNAFHPARTQRERQPPTAPPHVRSPRHRALNTQPLQMRRELDAERIEDLKEVMKVIEKKLKVEVLKRVEMNKALQKVRREEKTVSWEEKWWRARRLEEREPARGREAIGMRG